MRSLTSCGMINMQTEAFSFMMGMKSWICVIFYHKNNIISMNLIIDVKINI